MTAQPDRIAQLEERMAELEGRRPTGGRRRPRLVRRFALIGLVLALTIPAGVVLASHQFSDVPTSHTFHDDVEALVDAGITSGCGGGKFCLNDPVTRGQMAAFMNRLGSLSGQPPSVNADRVDGRHASSLIRMADWGTIDTTSVPAGGLGALYGPEFTITAPSAGFVAVDMSFTVKNSSCTTECAVAGNIFHQESLAASLPAFASPTTSQVFGSASLHHVFAVQAGVNTFQLELHRSDLGNGTVQGWFGMGTAIYGPFGSTGGSTLGLDSPEVDAAKLEP
jgi:hypothetical protein